MEFENTNTPEASLIDIFYKDTERLNSIISQINKGTLHSLTTKSEDLQGSSYLVEGHLGISSSNAGCSNQAKEENKRTIEEVRLIEDFSVIDLLQNLNLQVLNAVTEQMLSNLVVVEGTIVLQNYKAITNAMPLLTPFYNSFGNADDLKLKELNIELAASKRINRKPPEIRNKIKSLEEDIRTLKANIEATKNIASFMPNILPFLPHGLGFEVTLENNMIFNGVLKDKYLIDSEEIILTTYNSNLPGTWKILGIIDSIDNTDDVNDIENPLSMINGVTTFFKKMLSPRPINGVIKPILIFRDLTIR